MYFMDYGVQGEHKKYPSPVIYVDILAMHTDFCVKFHTAVKEENIHTYSSTKLGGKVYIFVFISYVKLDEKICTHC